MCSCVDGNLSNAFWMKRYGRFVGIFNWTQLDNYKSNINNSKNYNDNDSINSSVYEWMNARYVYIHTSISCVQYYVMHTRCVCAQTNQRLTAKKVKLIHGMAWHGCLVCCFFFTSSFIHSSIHPFMCMLPSLLCVAV